MSPFWVAFWTGEAIVFALTGFAVLGPLRHAHRLANQAFAEDAKGLEVLTTGGDHDDFLEHHTRGELLYEECFAWHAVTRRIQFPALILSVVLVLALIVRAVVS